MLILNGTMVIQTFFALSGFLLANRFATKLDEKVKPGHVLIAILYRYIR